jgi:hypothetical protein
MKKRHKISCTINRILILCKELQTKKKMKRKLSIASQPNKQQKLYSHRYKKQTKKNAMKTQIKCNFLLRKKCMSKAEEVKQKKTLN